VGKLANFKWKVRSLINEKDFKMTTTVSQTVFSPWLTPVRLVSTSNIAGTYYNGPNNNGVGATLTIAASSLTVDSVVAAVGDRILLHTQTNTYEQGIYVVKSIDSTVVLERSDDQQSLEQLKAGEYVPVGAGSVNAGNFFTLVEPLPQTIGVDAMVFNADPSAGGVSFSGGASTANAIPVFSDTSGNIKAASTTATLGQSLSVTGAVTASTTLQGANLKYGATPVAQVDPASCTITAVAGAANTATVTIQLKDGSGTNMSRIIPFKVYASSAADGLTLASAASTGFSVASGGLSLNNGTAITTQISCMSSATGGCVLSLLDTAKQTSYLVLVLANGCKISAQLSAGSYG
jgi:hypothetical protein